MDRKKFLKNGLLGLAATASVPALAKPAISTYDKLMAPIGFNHLPNEEERTGKSVLHRAATRGHADHGWLDTHHSFSFANYRNPERMHFGALRVLNDDVVAGGRGFRMHPHDNMEIVSIPLSGGLRHADSMGNEHVIRTNDIQVMSAGTGIRHSEYNQADAEAVRFLQIWLFPRRKGYAPRYDQLTLDPQTLKNRFAQILSPSKSDDGVWINQDAWFHLGHFDAGQRTDYTLKGSGTGVYAFVLEGDLRINEQALSRRDGYGLWDIDRLQVETRTAAKVLLMEVPMQL